MSAYAVVTAFALVLSALSVGSPVWAAFALITLGALATRLVVEHRERIRSVGGAPRAGALTDGGAAGEPGSLDGPVPSDGPIEADKT